VLLRGLGHGVGGLRGDPNGAGPGPGDLGPGGGQVVEGADVRGVVQPLAGRNAVVQGRGDEAAGGGFREFQVKTETLSTAEQDRLLEHTDRLGICVDVSVAAFMQEDPVEQLRKYRDRLAYVHMKDWTQGKFCTLGRGTVGLDVPAVLRTLTELDYRGWVMTELSPYADTPAEASCYDNREYLRSIGY
jgi:hypothetical protein